MRLVRLKIKSVKVKTALRQVASQFRTGDAGFVEDMFALIRLKGNGIPSIRRQDAVIKQLQTKGGMSPVNAKISVKKRVHVLSQAKSTAYFKGLCALPDPIDSTRRLLINFQRMYMKYREVQCLTCAFRSNCDFGKQYQDQTTDIRQVVDPDFQKKVNPQCPVLPEIDSVNQFAASVKQFKHMAKKQQAEAEVVGADLKGEDEKIAEEEDTTSTDDAMDILDPEDNDYLDFSSPSGDGSGTHDAGSLSSHRGALYVKHFEKMTNDLSREDLAIFELGAKLDEALLTHKKGKFEPTTEMSADRQQRKMETAADEARLVPSEHGKPKELYEQGIAKKQLIKKQDVEPKKKKPLLYLLIDMSYSMRTFIPSNAFGALSRAALASVFAMALVRRVQAEGGIVYVRFFAGTPAALQQARTADQFKDLLMFIAHCDFNAGGTQITAVLSTAVSDIDLARDEISKSEIILISDVEDTFSLPLAKKALNGHEVNILDVAAIEPSSKVEYGASKTLKKLAKKYYKVDPTSLKVEDIISVV